MNSDFKNYSKIFSFFFYRNWQQELKKAWAMQQHKKYYGLQISKRIFGSKQLVTTKLLSDVKRCRSSQVYFTITL